MKKAQAEIIGLLVIILLFIFIALFFILFSSKPESDIITEIREDLETSNLHSSLLKTTICNQKTLKNLIKECYKAQNINICDICPRITDCNQNICDFTALELQKAINSTLDQKRNYHYLVFYEDTTLIEINTPLNLKINCENQVFQDTNQIPVQNNLIELDFKTCLAKK